MTAFQKNLNTHYDRVERIYLVYIAQNNLLDRIVFKDFTHNAAVSTADD
jgi:hypothetical protein